MTVVEDHLFPAAVVEESTLLSYRRFTVLNVVRSLERNHPVNAVKARYDWR